MGGRRDRGAKIFQVERILALGCWFGWKQEEECGQRWGGCQGECGAREGVTEGNVNESSIQSSKSRSSPFVGPSKQPVQKGELDNLKRINGVV